MSARNGSPAWRIPRAPAAAASTPARSQARQRRVFGSCKTRATSRMITNSCVRASKSPEDLPFALAVMLVGEKPLANELAPLLLQWMVGLDAAKEMGMEQLAQPPHREGKRGGREGGGGGRAAR